MKQEYVSFFYRNIFGKSINRKIVVLESDDWGSIRIRSRKDSEDLRKAGIDLSFRFNKYDCLESNEDLEALFESLCKFIDCAGNHPVFTPLCVLANPNFEKIKENGFSRYVYEPFIETCSKYKNHDKVYELWKQGVDTHLFIPQFHGREHLNPLRWLRILAGGNPAMLEMFDHESFGIRRGFDNSLIPVYLPGFDPEKPEDIPFIFDSITEGLSLFRKMLGYDASYFVPCTSSGISGIEPVLLENGIKYVNVGRIYKIPDGNGKQKLQFGWIGKKNGIGQKYIVRNCFFEPIENGVDDSVGRTLREIDASFRMHKPAVISTHRMNYVGYIDERNRTEGLKQLESLLSSILKRWPDVEFMTTSELAELL